MTSEEYTTQMRSLVSQIYRLRTEFLQSRGWSNDFEQRRIPYLVLWKKQTPEGKVLISDMSAAIAMERAERGEK